jgi:hypothetical protein
MRVAERQSIECVLAASGSFKKMNDDRVMSAAELAARAEDYGRFAEESMDAECRVQLASIARTYRAAAVIASRPRRAKSR